VVSGCRDAAFRHLQRHVSCIACADWCSAWACTTRQWV
jgi:hypothetical protein